MKKSIYHLNPSVSYGVWLSFGIFLYFYLRLFENALIDDAFITLRYVKTLLTSGTWGFFPDVVANSATSPLNVLLLAIMSLLTGPTVNAALWLYFLCLISIACILTRLSVQLTGSEISGWLASSALVFNPLLISTMGLESIVFSTLLVVALYVYQLQKWIVLAISLGLLTLARPEGILFFLIFLLFVPTNMAKKQMVITYVLCIMPWHIFSWIFLGSFLPDTFLIKTEQRAWLQSDFFNGMTNAYYYSYPSATILSFIFLPFTTLIFDKKTREVNVLVIVWLAGWIHFLGYSLLRVPPFHWYYVPQVLTIILFGSLSLGAFYRKNWLHWQKKLWEVVVVGFFLLPALGMLYNLARNDFIVREMPIHSNWATYVQYKAIGLWLKENHETDIIHLQGSEIGTLAYYCDCYLLDQFSDRSWLRDYITKHTSRPGITSTLLQVNFAFYSDPVFPPISHTLKVYSTQPDTGVEVIKTWEISTRWIRHALVVFSREK